IDLIDICLPTHLHLEYALAALASGKHVLLEKPMARTSADALRIAEAADKARGLSMVAMCLRFWPGWTFLKDAVVKGTYGKPLGVHLRRVASHPGGAFYSNGELSGGAALDLHIHDTDFVHYLFGVPKAVYTAGYSKVTNQPDHLVTHYRYDDVPLVTAEGCWCMSAGFPFKMQFTANFERATLIYDFPGENPLTLVQDGKAQPVALEPGMGYDFEVAYFLDCIKSGRKPDCVTMRQAADTVRIVEAEVQSSRSGQVVSL
ncbi:MAG: Gfo/Idh/MocA family oxidoreductase, partial [Rhodospirillales bacterium]|nr:Gfo/Idh/MocA family oxidoreductase [Rhodospirillales bacterium]